MSHRTRTVLRGSKGLGVWVSDQSGGEGWWLASDGKWYPPAPPGPAQPVPAVPPPPSASVGNPISAPPRFCTQCAAILDGAAYCTTCGTPVGASPPPAPSVVANAQPDRSGRNLAVVLLLAGAGMALGSFLPWVKVTAPFIGTLTKSGIEGGDGWFTLVAGGVVAFAGFTLLNRDDVGTLKRLVILAAVVAGILCIYEYSDISSRFADARAEADSSGDVFGVSASDLLVTTYGAGLHLITGSTVVAFIAGLRLPSRTTGVGG